MFNTTGQPTAIAYPSGSGNAGNGTSGTLGYDSLGRQSTITWSGPGSTTITSDAVTRREDGKVVGEVVDGTDHHAGDDFVYDAAGRLSEAWAPGAKYDYDFFQNGFCTAPDSYENTNRTGMIVTPTGGSAVVTNYCYDHADRLTLATDASVGTTTYDAHGNTTGIFGETRTYDVADRHLTTTKAATTVTYVRDALDRIVERKVNGTTTARYGYTGSSDAPSFVTNSSNAVLEVTFALPGGALLTTRSGGNVWSYPNIHGDLVATASQSGVKQGSTVAYDPYGNVVAGTLPDNSADDFDHGWLGEHQRPLEHEPTLQPIVEMGARQYSPLLGRFLEVDPVVGGSCNAYEYVCADPIGGLDLSGTLSTFDGCFTNICVKIGLAHGQIYIARKPTEQIYSAVRAKVSERVIWGFACAGFVKGGYLRERQAGSCARSFLSVDGDFVSAVGRAHRDRSCLSMKFSVVEVGRAAWHLLIHDKRALTMVSDLLNKSDWTSGNGKCVQGRNATL